MLSLYQSKKSENRVLSEIKLRADVPPAVASAPLSRESIVGRRAAEAGTTAVMDGSISKEAVAPVAGNLCIAPYNTRLSKISKKAREKVAVLLEANYRFCNIFYQKYLKGTQIDIHNINRELLNLSRTKFRAQLDTPGYKIFANEIQEGLAKEVEDFSEKLQLLRQEADHQRIVDDLYEEARCMLAQVDYVYEKMRDKDKTRAIKDSLFNRLKVETRKEFKKNLEPYRSEFQILFEKHYPLKPTMLGIVNYGPQAGKRGFVEEIIKELKLIEALYCSKDDLEGLKHIASQLAILATDASSCSKFTKRVLSYAYRRASAILSNEQQTIRAVNYCTYLVLVEAREFKRTRETIWKQQSKMEKMDRKSKKETIVIQTQSMQAENAVTPKETIVAEAQSMQAENPVTPLEVSTCSATLLSAPKFGGSSNDKKQAKDKPAAEPGSEIHPLASVIQGKHKTTLVALFDKAGLSYAKIKLQSILDFFTAIGCKVSQNGVRVSFIYQNVLGYCLGEQNIEGQANGFHVKDRDGNHGGRNPYLHEVALEHCKDFCENIGIVPTRIWPNEFPATAIKNANAAKAK